MHLIPQKINLRWSDLDPNFHLRHSSYYELATECRIEMLATYGLTLAVMEEQHFAPVILREECVFVREIKYTDNVYIHLEIKEINNDGTKWTIVHHFIDENKKKKAVLTVETAWFDTRKRRLVKSLPDIARKVHELIMQ